MENCCVCFNGDENLLNINHKTANNHISIIGQLELLVPEVTWLEDYAICCKCRNFLNLIDEFRQKCLGSQRIREMEIKEEKPNIVDCSCLKPVIKRPNSDLPEQISNDIKESSKKIIACLESKLVCVECGETFKTKPELNIHGKLHLNECGKCEKRFDTSLNLQAHLVAEHTDPIYWRYHCEFCDKRFPLKQLYDEHIKDHNVNLSKKKTAKKLVDALPKQTERTNMCIYCGKAFKTKTELNVHEKIHLNKREYHCKICNKQFNTHKNLHTHNLIKHTDPVKWHYHCEICQKRFAMKGTYDQHRKLHQNIKDFQCTLCDKQFSSKSSLKIHIISHSNLKLYKCDLCNLEYKFKHSFLLHQFRKHQIGNCKLRPKGTRFTCEKCGKGFDLQSDLHKHSFVHSDGQLFKCDLCGTKFKHKRSVGSHKIKYHNMPRKDEIE